MRLRLQQWFNFLFSIEKHERIKVLFLTLSFFFIIGAYTLVKELKDSIFVAVVGKEYVALAKLLSIFFLVPSILMYSKLVDQLRRYHLLAFYCALYGVIGIIFALLLKHPTIGIVNTNSSPYRTFGWLFYFFIEGYSPFVISVFWAFSNSVNTPHSAKKSYGLMVSGSKVGGMVTSMGAWLLLGLDERSNALFTHAFKHQVLLMVSSCMLLVVPIIIFLLVRSVSGHHLHGYEAVYQVEKERQHHPELKAGIFSGLKMLCKYPYTMGIFFVGLFYEIIQTVLSYQRLGIAQQHAQNVSQVSAFLFAIAFYTHLCGLPISLFGTRALMSKFGERLCLLMVPALTLILFIGFKLFSTKLSFIVFFAVLRAIHYAFDYPLRESLYIPTVKEIKFKSKSWIDSFGSKFAKGVGSLFNGVTAGLTTPMFLTLQSVFFSILIGCWFLVAYALGKRFEKAIESNKVIGID